MRAKSVDFIVTYINLREKPDWFLKISPHGKVPVLLVNDQPLFESSAIAEFLDEVVEPRLHPQDPFERAQHGAWTDYTPTFSGLLGNVYYSNLAYAVAPAKDQARVVLAKLEAALSLFNLPVAAFFVATSYAWWTQPTHRSSNVTNSSKMR